VKATLIALLSIIATCASAQTPLPQLAPERTWPELKEAIRDRVKRQAYPLTGYDIAAVEDILSRIQSRDPEEWARAWSATAEKHLAAAEASRASNPGRARQEYLEAWKYFGFGAWPAQTSSGKKRAHEQAVRAFRSYVVRLALPRRRAALPRDGHARDERGAAAHRRRRRAHVLAYPRLPCLQERHRPAAHRDQGRLVRRLLGDARRLQRGASPERGRRLGWSDRRVLHARLAGESAGHARIRRSGDDLYVLMRRGSPKEAWVNPEGGHIGRNREWSDIRIFREVILPWLQRRLGAAKP
jgi:hypothetical protein